MKIIDLPPPLYDKAAIDKLFAENAVYLFGHERVPEFRLVELFGVRVTHWIDAWYRLNNFEIRSDYVSGYGKLRYLTHLGVHRILSEVNCDTLETQYQSSNAKVLIDKVRAQEEAIKEEKRQRRKAAKSGGKTG